MRMAAKKLAYQGYWYFEGISCENELMQLFIDNYPVRIE
jgi:hypothetical protein